MLAELIYIVATLLHGVGLYYGLKTWYKGQSLFINSSPLHFFKSEIERKFWTVVVGVASNLSFLIALPLYLYLFKGSSVGTLEPIFIAGHLTSALATAIWHHLAFTDIIRIKREANEGIIS